MSSARATTNARWTAATLPFLTAVSLLALTDGLQLSEARAEERSEYQHPIATSAIEAGASNGFRLGTAASPFGWATAIADFNADGRPDFAVVDRVDSSAEQYRYDVEVTVSGVRVERLELTSPSDAVSIVAEDIDHDDDLDIVITATLTREVLAVWLNDGSGRFSQASLRDVPSHLPSLRIIEAEVSCAAADAVVVSRRALLECCATRHSAADALAMCGDVVRFKSSSTRLALLSSLRPRAPPYSL